MSDGTLSAFRKKRGKALAAKISTISNDLGRPIRILDVGGRRDYWSNVGFEGVDCIRLLNIDKADLGRTTDRAALFVDTLGNACDLKDIDASSYDLYHSNSVIEHVGGWGDMQAMAREARRVSAHGWVQTPAWEFPLEPHFRLPFMHWFSTPTRAALLRLAKHYRTLDRSARRLHAERINLLTHGEVKLLFPDTEIIKERVVITKSYVVTW